MTGFRINCCIDGCRRSAPRHGRFADSDEIICGKHWRTIDRPFRDRHKQLRRRYRRFMRLLMRKALVEVRTVADIDAIGDALDRACARNWQQCKTDAQIKAAFGVEVGRNAA